MLNEFKILDATRIALVLATMLYSSYSDWVSREVDDKVWIVSGIIGGILTILDLILTWSFRYLILTLISIGIGCGFAYAFYYFGFYGGADAKAVMVISVSLPLYYPPKRLHPFTGLASLSNGLLISLIIPVSMLILNLSTILRGENIFEGFEHESRIRKLAAIFLGVRVKDARRRKFWLPLEEEKDGKRFFSFNILTFELEEPKRDDCWVTPGLPLLLFITAGFLVFIFLGDVIYMIASIFIH
ncbi:MAG TPA: A24 family peptidase [Nitrososphaeria archaeon]|nr:A24 family peptidase [Nitrososphaeria archaeon]